MIQASTAPTRPVPVTLVSILVMLEGLVVLAGGIAVVVFRDNSLVDLPVLVARIDEALPFDSGQDIETYVAWVGAVIAAFGVVLLLLGWGVHRGVRVAYLLAFVLLAVLSFGALYLRSHTDDELAQLALVTLAVLLLATLVALALLLVGRRSRAWVAGR